jgi:hypothetical protein
VAPLILGERALDGQLAELIETVYACELLDRVAARVDNMEGYNR